MARLGCKCGAEMTNTISPSKNILNIFYIKEAMDAIHSNPNIKLWDFYTGWDEKNSCNNSFQNRAESVEYWYCTNCKRVYEVQAKPCGIITKTYHVNEECYSQKPDLSSLKELLVLADIDMDKLLSQNEMLKLQEYLSQKRLLRVFINDDKSTVYVINTNNNNTLVYTRED